MRGENKKGGRGREGETQDGGGQVGRAKGKARGNPKGGSELVGLWE